MKFLADEGVDKSIVDLLRNEGYDVWYVAELSPSTDDQTILEQALADERILITRDKDFGELVFRLHKLHSGVVLIRLDGYETAERAMIVHKLITLHQNRLPKAFSVIQKGAIRIR